MGRVSRIWLSLLLLSSWILSSAPVAWAAPERGVVAPSTSRFARPRWRPSARRDFSFATFNLQNLYRFRRAAEARPANRGQGTAENDNRASYLPATRAQYLAKVRGLAATIVKDLTCPDLLALQEVENFKRGAQGASVLSDLVSQIQRQSKALGREVKYRFMLDHGQSDRRGISQAYLYREDRVKPAAPSATDPIFGTETGALLGSTRQRAQRYNLEVNSTSENPKSINKATPRRVRNDGYGTAEHLLARPVLAGLFEVYRDGVASGGPHHQVYVLNKHLLSNPNLYQERRKAQAEASAKLVRGLLAQNPRAMMLVAGDMNVDFNQLDHRRQLNPLEELTPDNSRSKNLLRNLGKFMKEKDDRFTYIYRGKKELLDWVFATNNLTRRLKEVLIPHVNSGADPERRSSDHDPMKVTFRLFN